MKIKLASFLALLFFLPNYLYAAPAPESLNSASAIIVNETTKQVIWQKNSAEVLPIASLTKLVAAKTFLDTGPNLNRVVTYKQQDEEYNYQYCEKSESGRLKLSDGETIKIKDLLYSSLISSTNNTFESLVRVSGLSRKDFIRRMNRNVINWGASSTHFEEPTGLSPQNVSTARDYTLIVAQVYKNKTIQKISSLPSYTFKTVNKKTPHYLLNTNKLVRSSPYKVIGAKNGFLYEAKYCLMTRVASPKNNKLIAVVLGAETSSDSLEDTKKLLDYGLSKVK